MEEMATHSILARRDPHGQRNLAGYSPWGCRESDTTERVSSCSQGSERLPILVLLHFVFYH